MENIKIVIFTMADYEEVLELWKASKGVGLSNDYSETPEEFKQFLDRNPGLSFVAKDSDKIVAAVLGSHDGRRGFITHLAVDKEYRRKGIGQLLTQHVLDSLKAARIFKVALFVLKDNLKGKAFWESFGFTRLEIADTYTLELKS